MDITTIGDLVKTIGFPAVVCIYSGWFIKYQYDQNNANLKTLLETFQTTIGNLTNQIQDNRQFFAEIAEKLNIEESEDK